MATATYVSPRTLSAVTEKALSERMMDEDTSKANVAAMMAMITQLLTAQSAAGVSSELVLVTSARWIELRSRNCQAVGAGGRGRALGVGQERRGARAGAPVQKSRGRTRGGPTSSWRSR